MVKTCLINILVVCALSFSSCERKEKKIPTPKIRTVECLSIVSHRTEEIITAQGIIHPYQQADLAFRLSSTVVDTSSYLGEKVEKDKILAILEKNDFKLQLLRAVENKKLAQANLARIKAKARPEKINAAKAKLDAAHRAHDFAQKFYKSQIRLKNSQILSPLELDRLKTDSLVKEKNVQVAEQELIFLENGSRVEDIEFAHRQVAVSDAEVKIAQQNIEYMSMKSPFAGIVSSYNLDKGEFVIPGKVVVSVHDLYKVKLKISVSEKQISHITTGQKVQVHLDALQQKTFTGIVSYAAYSADSVSRTFSVEIIIDNPDLKIRSGMFATANIFIKNVREIILIPPKSILKDFDGDYVYVLSDDPNKTKNIKVVHRRILVDKLKGQSAIVQSGLKQDEWLVISGHHYISDNEVVNCHIATEEQRKETE
ncbi:efflux RND transporter periplasmic adaptor subunit [Candidatus Uabimicrobium sp. HlEnr_7]|uniref:efflux RND transporter periplasmic adaptor subunit n=1 Tax=Candidatus Uabimicrobium helgolandensis TaxID=3095367 RepID=UPI0035578E77